MSRLKLLESEPRDIVSGFCLVESFLLKKPTCDGRTGERIDRKDFFHLLYQPGVGIQSVVIFLFQSLNRKVQSLSVYRSGLNLLDRNLDDVVINPGEAHLDLVIQVRPA